MKNGFRICIHKSCKKEDYNRLINEAENFISQMKNGYGTGYHKSFYNRGVFGCKIDNNYTFKRLSTKRRIFGIIPIELLEGEIDLNRCYCPTCLGGTKVKIKDGFIESDYKIIFEIGEIKG